MTVDNPVAKALEIPKRSPFMRNTGYLVSVFLVALLAAGCNGESNGGNGDGDAGNDADAGPECQTNDDCPLPKTCQPDNTCVYIPDPNANKADVSFMQMEMDYSGVHGIIVVDGKFKGNYLYMDYGGIIDFNQAADRVEMQLFGMITNTLMNALVIHLPRDCPTGQPIKFGTDGIAIGTLDRVELNDNGYEIGRTTVGEIVDGSIVFGEYGDNPGSPISGTGEVHFRPIN